MFKLHTFAIRASVLLLFPLTLHSQADLTLTSTILGNADVTATNTITLGPGFETKPGSEFYAHISSTAQPAYSTTTVTETSSSSTKSTMATGDNYIRTLTYRAPYDTEQTGDFEHTEQIGYFDGLGRPIQSVSVKASPGQKDIIQPIVYDAYGREVYKPLPYLDDLTDGSFRTGITNADLSKINTYYNTLKGDNRAFAQIGYDNSPLNRVVSQTGTGSAWENKPATINYLTNTSTVKGWNVTGDYTYDDFTYAASSLYVTETIDEEGRTTREYKDKQGQVVLKESVLDATNTLRTYYIYDDFGLLRCVVPPLANGDETKTDLTYRYLYDSRNRMVEKQIPGGGTIKMVYDQRDRLRLTQNSLQAASNQWSFTKYDVFNRPIINGIFTSSQSSSALKTALDAEPMNETYDVAGTNSYTNTSFPKTSTTVTAITVHSVTWYDTYGYITALTLGTGFLSETYNAGDYDFTSKKDADPIGRVTGTMTVVLSSVNDPNTVTKSTLYSAMYYDKYGNTLRTISDNILGGKDISSTDYEPITFLPNSTKQQHTAGTESDILVTRFAYDHAGRLLATYLTVNNQPEITQSAVTWMAHKDKRPCTYRWQRSVWDAAQL